MGEATQRFLQTLYYEPESKGPFARTRARAVNWVTLNVGKWVISTTFAAMGAYAMGRAGDTLGLTPETVTFTVRTIKEMDLSKVDKNIYQIILDALRNHVNGLFKGITLQFLMVLGIALAVAVTEIVVYRMLERRRRALPGPPEPGAAST